MHIAATINLVTLYPRGILGAGMNSIIFLGSDHRNVKFHTNISLAAAAFIFIIAMVSSNQAEPPPACPDEPHSGDSVIQSDQSHLGGQCKD